MKLKKVVSAVLVSALAVSMMAGCGSKSGNSDSKSDVFKIGGIGPMTGDAAAYGEAVDNGAKLAVEEFEKRMAAAMEKIYEKAAQLGGKVSGEHGIGFAKKPYLRESLDTETIELMSGIKKAFDPKNILNPHKVFQS